MSFYKFTNNDLFVNFLSTNPSCKFDIYNSQIFYNNRPQITGEVASDLLSVPPGHISLYEMNVDRADTNLIYSFITKDSSLTTFKTVSTSEFYSLEYGTDITGAAYPLSASITREFFDTNHFATMQSNNETIINDERTEHLGQALAVEGTATTNEGLPDFKLTDKIATTTGTRNSLERFDRLRGLLSSSHINSLKTSINAKSFMSPHFSYSKTFGNGYSRNLDEVPVNLISVPTIFYGSQIERGTIDLRYYLTGTLIGQLKDENKNGELIQVGPEGSTGSGSVAGIALYKEGCIILTGSWDLQTTGPSADAKLNYKNTGTAVTSSWLYYGVGANDGIPTDGEGADTRASASYAMYLSGTNEVPVMTMLAHAAKGELNFSNNPTFLSRSTAEGYYTSNTGSVFYGQKELELTNIVSSSFETPTASFAKETYISKIGLYDKNKNLIGVTTVAKPVKKTEDREFTFKIKMDI